MSIEKYLKSTPDYVIPNTTGYSTDGQNLRCYRLGNAGDVVGYDWCFATNYNDEVRYNNTILGNSDSLETNKNGYMTENVDGNLYFDLNKDNLAENYKKLSGGLCGGILYVPNDVAEADIHNCYVIENLDFNRVLLKVTAYGTINNPVVAEKRNIDNENEGVLNAGYLIEVNILNNNVLNTVETIGIRYVEYFISDGFEYIKPYYINARELQPNSRNNTQSASDAYNNSPLSKPYYREQDGLAFNTPYWDNNHHIVTTMYPCEKYKLWEEFTRSTPYYSYYASYVTNHATINDLIHLLNSSGLRYYDSDHSEITDVKNNVFIGIMDEDGVTDCYSRLKGWDEIESSDLPNKDRNGYDWIIKDPSEHTPTDEDEIDDMKLGVGRNYSGMVKYYRLDPAQLLLFSQEIQKESVVPAGYDVMKNIIALKRFPVNLNAYAEFSEPALIKLGSVTVPLSASQLDGEKKNIGIGKYTIQGYHGTKENPHFLDFSPYTTAEVFIPYCGFVTIPTDKIMYNEIEVRLLVDVKLGNCTGVVKCNGNIVGQKSGVLGADIPLVAVNMGVAMGAVVQGLMDTTIGFVSAIPYAAAGNTAATFSGVLNGTSALTQTIMSSRKNYTEVIGTTGGDIMFTMPDKCYIKLTYPKKNLPDNYGKMVGYMCGKGGRLGDFKGFTICENVHVNVKATEEEKQMILEKLLTGVIMPYNG